MGLDRYSSLSPRISSAVSCRMRSISRPLAVTDGKYAQVVADSRTQEALCFISGP